MSNKSKKVEVEKCSVCREQQSKYHCPADRAPYCSVVCFKQHKTTKCAASSTKPTAHFATGNGSSTSSSNNVVTRGQQDDRQQQNKAQAELKSLDSLMWPPDPLEEGLNALSDPLNRDEPKPLLHSELLAIATSIPLREMLSSHPFLKDMLQDIARIPNAPPKYPQSKRIRDVLGLGETDGIPNNFTYRPKEEADHAKDAFTKRPNFNANSGRIGEEERKALHQFNELVKTVLQEERAKSSAVT